MGLGLKKKSFTSLVVLFLYTLAIHLYHLGIKSLAALRHNKALRWYQGRKDAKEFSMPSGWQSKNKIWIHSASFGEYEMAKPIVSRLLEDERNRIYVSFYSPSGFENIHFSDPRIHKFYLPIDLKSSLVPLLDKLQPDSAVFIKYEFWFNLLKQLKSRAIPYYFTSLHINESSYLLRIPTFRNLIKSAKSLYCHNPHSIEILEKSGFENLKVFGDSRVNKALENLREERPDLQWVRKAKTIVFGSLLSSEIKMMAELIKRNPDYNYLIAPHDIDAGSLAEVVDKLTLPFTKLTEIKGTEINNNILIINTLGDLKFLYSLADVVYVGGGFGKGPHSIIEPLAYGTPTIIGPNIGHYPMARTLKKSGHLTVIEQESDLSAAIANLIETSSDYSEEVKAQISSLQVNLDPLIEELSH